MTLTHTHTYAVLEVSPLVYAEIKDKLKAAGYDQALHESGVIDLNGLALQSQDGPGSDSAEKILEAAAGLKDIITDAKAKLLLALEAAAKVGYHMRQVQRSYFTAKTGKHDLLVESKRLEAAFDRRLSELRELGVDFTK